MEISVIMANYNTDEKILRESIESILSQSFTDFEFIIVDDGSSNNSVETIKSYNDSRIKLIINDTNIGQTASFNKAIKAASGKYLARMDADDISLKDRFKTQYSYMESHNNCVACGCHTHCFGDVNYNVRRINFSTNVLKCRLIFDNCLFAHPTVMIRKSIMDKYNILYNEEYKSSQDYELWQRLVELGDVHIIQKVLLNYRVHIKQVSSDRKQEQKSYKDSIKLNNINKIPNLNLTKEEENLFLTFKNGGHDSNELKNLFMKIITANDISATFPKKELYYELNYQYNSVTGKQLKKNQFLDSFGCFFYCLRIKLNDKYSF